MECQTAGSLAESLLCRIWQIPEPVATLAGALATVIAGFFVIIGALIAWKSVQRQIRSSENIELARRSHEISAIEAGFTSELLVYSRGIIEATSLWNQRASHSPNNPVTSDWPVFIEPLYYTTNIGKIGMIRQPFIAGALISFYSNLWELKEQAREAFTGKPTVNITSRNIALRLQLMTSNLAQSLDGLNDNRKFRIFPGIEVRLLCAPDGTMFGEGADLPKNLQEILWRLAGIAKPPQ